MFATLEAPKTVITVVHQPRSKTHVFAPQFGEKVIYFNEDRQEFRSAIYFGLWMERNSSSEASPFLHECLPYCGKAENQVYRAFILDLEGFSDYANVELIGECNMANIEWAHSQNHDLRQQAAIERLAAFGEVEAVA